MDLNPAKDMDVCVFFSHTVHSVSSMLLSLSQVEGSVKGCPLMQVKGIETK